MRISDWSSDVCSSDLNTTSLGRQQRACEQDKTMAALLGVNVDRTVSMTFVMGAALAAVAGVMVTLYYGVVDFFLGFLAGLKAFTRSDEHTSELQSLMRNSYAGLCLKKQTLQSRKEEHTHETNA